MKRIVIAVAMLSLLGGSAALAQPRHDRDRDGIPNRVDPTPNRPNYGGRGDRDHDGIPNRADRQPNRFNYRGQAFDRFRGPSYAYPRGFGYRSWARGQILPRAFFGSPYYVDNWSSYRLGPPLPGFRYVRVGPDILLVNIRTGLISETIPGVFY